MIDNIFIDKTLRNFGSGTSNIRSNSSYNNQHISSSSLSSDKLNLVNNITKNSNFISFTPTNVDSLVNDAVISLNDAKQKIAIWNLSVDKANLLVNNKVSNKNTLVNIQNEMVSARNDAIKSRQAAVIAVDNSIKKINELIKTVGLIDDRGNQLYREYQNMSKEFENVEQKHNGVFDKLCKWIGYLFNIA